MKKQKAKKGGKKKEDKTETPAEAEAEASTEAANTEEKTEEKTEQVAPEPIEATSVPPPPAEDEEEDEEPSELPKQPHGRKPSVAIESRQRSESFYRSGAAGPLSPGVGVTSEVYREQAQKIEELEKENKRLTSEVEENERRWKKGEEELEELRESRGDAALAVEKGKEVDALVSTHSIYSFFKGNPDLSYRERKLSRSRDSFLKHNHKATNPHAVQRPHLRAKAHQSTI